MVQLFGPAEVEEGLVDGKGFDQRRQRPHHFANLAAGACVFRHVGRNDLGVGTRCQRLEHRHCRAHAIHARDIAGGQYDPTAAPADDHGLVTQGRIISLFHTGVKGIAIDMGDRQPLEFVVGNQPRRAAVRAARRPLGADGQAVAAERAHAGSPGGHSQAAPRTPLESPWRGGRILVAT